MTFTPVEIIAGLFAAIGIIKILVILIDKSKWHNHVVKPIYGGNTGVVSLVSVVLAFVILYYLLMELTIVQIFAVMGFFSMLIMFSFIQYQKELTGFIDKVYKKDFNCWLWFYIVLWVALSFWVLYLILL
tara:strand:+ start:461 stop:850 length:390 start_codon:yes stop_codon:yes gene_type:complete